MARPATTRAAVIPVLEGIATMLDTVERYFQSGRRVCLPGAFAFALAHERDRFADRVQGYFSTWRAELTRTLDVAGVDAAPDCEHHQGHGKC